jgi:hypothetical protein
MFQMRCELNGLNSIVKANENKLDLTQHRAETFFLLVGQKKMRGSFKRMGVLGNHSDKFETKFSSMFHRERDEKKIVFGPLFSQGVGTSSKGDFFACDNV